MTSKKKIKLRKQKRRKVKQTNGKERQRKANKTVVSKFLKKEQMKMGNLIREVWNQKTVMNEKTISDRTLSVSPTLAMCDFWPVARQRCACSG